MKRIKLYQLINIIVLAFLVPVILLAQTELTQSIKGTVLEKGTDFPLIGVNVLIVDDEKTIGTTTDIDGRYLIENVPVGRQTLIYSYLGYQSVTISNVLVQSAKELVIEIKMDEEVTKLDEVVVNAQKEMRKAMNEMATVSARTMSVEDINRYSGSLGDVSRMAQNYAGVSGASDDRNDIIIRGNSPSNVLWRVEGIDIPSPNHWSTFGTTGGPISMLNTNNLRSSDFLTSAFPAEYGNASSGVFDLKLKNGNSDKYEFLGQIGFNGFEGGVEGPLSIGNNASFIVNYRYSTLKIFSLLGLDFGTGAAVPEYQDLVFKINVPTEKLGRFSLWGIGGISDIRFEPTADKDNLFSENDEDLTTGAKTGMMGLSHFYFFNENTSSNLSIGLSRAESFAFIESLRKPENENLEPTFASDNSQNKLSINWVFNKKLNAKNRLKSGVSMNMFDLNIKDSVYLKNSEIWWTETDFDGNLPLYQAFTQWQHKFNNKFTLNTGLHAIYTDLNESFSLEPRAALAYKMNDKHTFSVGYGRHSGLQPLPIYFAKSRLATDEENAANQNLDFYKSDQFVLGWDYLLGSNARVKIEAYYQSLFDVAVSPTNPDFSMINFGSDFGFPNEVGLLNEGTGTNYGLEITLERFLKNGFYYLMTASIFESTYKGYDEVERNTYYNSNYVTNLLIGKEFEFSKKFSLLLDAKFNVSGGRRYTPLDLDASIAAGDEVYDQTNIFGARLNTYIRPDLKIGFRMNSKKYSQVFSVDLQNFIGRKNSFGFYYDANKQEIRESYQRGFFPDVRYQILF